LIQVFWSTALPWWPLTMDTWVELWGKAEPRNWITPVAYVVSMVGLLLLAQIRFTEREAEVLKLVARGMSNAQIAETLVVGETTVKTHVARVLDKLELQNRVQAATLRMRWDLWSWGQGEEVPPDRFRFLQLTHPHYTKPLANSALWT
jgi:DNA-binding CsgD family transcriptional regulator